MFRKTLAEKSIALILVLGVMVAQVLSILPVTEVQAATSGKFKYDVYNGKAQIRCLISDRSYTGDITIPAIIDGFPVTSIGTSAFIRNTGIGSVSIPGSVTNIGEAAFYGCTGITSVSIPGSVTSMGQSAFQDCKGLSSVTIEEGVTNIGENAFYGCTGITSVSIPGSVTNIGKYAFRECTGLSSVTIEEGVTNIGEAAFYGCTGITSVSIPGSVTSMGQSAFQDCKGLSSVSLGEGITGIGDHAFNRCTGITSVSIPGSVTNIGKAAFSGCTGITSVSIPESVTSIGALAFYDCTGLSSITFNSPTTKLGTSLFPFKTKVIGYDPSTAKNYAAEQGCPFEVIGGSSTQTPSNSASNISSQSTPANTNNINQVKTPLGNSNNSSPNNNSIPTPSKTTNPAPVQTPSTNNSNAYPASGGVSVYVNNAPVSFPDQKPFIDQNGRTQVPLRAAGQAIGLAIDWDDASKTVTLSKDGKTARLSIGSNIIYIDGKATIMDTCPMLAGGRTVLPFRYVAQAFGAEVSWDPMSKRATVSQGNNSTSQNSTKSTENYQNFFGEWKITKAIGVAPVAGMTDDEVASYIGKKLLIAQNAFTDLDGSVVKNPSYKQKAVSNEDFYTDWHMNLDAIGLKSSSINEIEISNANSYTGFYLIDDNNIIYALDGVFFKLQK